MRWPVVIACVAVLIVAGCLGPAAEPTGATVGKRARGGQPTLSDEEPLLVPPELPKTASWQSLPSAQFPRVEHCVANVEHVFVIVGGFIVPHPVSAPGTAGGVGVIVPTNTVEIFDAKTESWSQGPAYATPLDHCMAVGLGGWVYVFHSSGSAKMKPGDDAWIAIPQMPHEHGGTSVAEAIGGLIYVAAGRPGLFVDVYDPVANTWSSVEAPITQPVNHVAGASLHDRIYALGGDISGHSNNSNATQEFDPVSQTWQNRTPLPVVRGSLFADVWFGHIVVMGGQNGATNVEAFDAVHAYEPITDTWTELPAMTNPRHGFGGGVWDNKLYVFGGAPQQGVSGFANADVLVPG